MKKIKDERLKLQNLQNLRIVFMVQTLGILAILGYEFIRFGFDKVISDPLWLVFLITGIVNQYLNLTISVDHKNSTKNPKNRLAVSLIILGVIAVVIGYFICNTNSYDIVDALISSGIIFISGLIPSIYVYRLRVKRNDE
ncbi:hypothetical protein ACS60E_06990 [Streptococcus suis]